jgi:hypothetical protein
MHAMIDAFDTPESHSVVPNINPTLGAMILSRCKQVLKMHMRTVRMILFPPHPKRTTPSIATHP